MQSIVQHPYSKTFHQTGNKDSAWKKFIHWADRQKEYRLGWIAFAITGHGCVFTTFTAVVVFLTGNHFIFWPFLIASMMMVIVVILAAMPTKVLIPVLFFSLVIDLVIIVCCLLNGFDMTGVYR